MPERKILLSAEEKEQLSIWSDIKRPQSYLKSAALIILLLSETQMSIGQVAEHVGVTENTVFRWKRVFIEQRLDCFTKKN